MRDVFQIELLNKLKTQNSKLIKTAEDYKKVRPINALT